MSNVDPDLKPHSVASDLGLDSLPWAVCPKTRRKYDPLQVSTILVLEAVLV